MNRLELGARGTLVFDGDCSFCSTSARLVRAIAGPAVRVVPFQRADLKALGITLEQAEEAVWWVGGDGRRERGHRAVAAALRAARGIWRPMGAALTVGPVDGLAARAYGWIARNRHRLPGGTPECRPEDTNEASDLRG